MRHALARAIVRIAGRLVPADLRRGWVEEWLAELWHEHRESAGAPVVRRALGSFRAAWAVRRYRPGGGSVGRITGRGGRTMMGRDLGQAARALLRSPAFTAVAVVTLALGFGATGAILAVVDTVLLRPLPYPEAERLVRLDHPVPGYGEDTAWGLSVAGYFHFQEGMTSLDEVGAWFRGQVNLTESEDPERLSSVSVTTPLLRALGVTAAAGRTFTDSDDDPGAERVALLSHALWVRRFGADPGVVGRVIRIDGTAVPVVGVLAEGTDVPGTEAEIWFPWTLDAEAEAQNSHYVQALARLAPGATLSGAREELARMTDRLPERFPGAYDAGFMRESGFTSRMRPLRDVVVGEIGTALWVVLAGVGLVLLMACANVANLFLVRAESRAREVAVRSAMGASRRAIGRFFVLEGILVAGVSAALGLALATLGLDALVALSPPGIPRLDEVRLSVPASATLVALALGVGALFGSFPMVQSRSRVLARLLGEGGRGRTSGPGAIRVRNGLLVVQVAMALVLLAGSGLMARSFQRLMSVDTGFDPDGVLTFEIGLPGRSYPGEPEVSAFHRGLLERLEASPAIAAAGAIDALPIAGGHRCIGIGLEPGFAEAAGDVGCPQVRFVAPGYFESLGIAVLEGRPFQDDDNASQTGALVVSRSMADLLWPNEPAIGRGARLWGPGFYRVVGVVDDIRGEGLTAATEPILYFPLRALPGESYPPVRDLTYAVRSATGSTEGLVAEVRAAVAELDPQLPVAGLRTMDDVLSRAMVRTTFTLLLMAIASVMALVIGVVGMYGVVSYVVAQRRREMGVRIALGAAGSQVTAMVLRSALALTVLGLVLGLGLSVASTGLLRSLLFEVSPTDPLTLGGVAILLVAVVTLAAWVPARRAARVDPVVALRSD